MRGVACTCLQCVEVHECVEVHSSVSMEDEMMVMSVCARAYVRGVVCLYTEYGCACFWSVVRHLAWGQAILTAEDTKIHPNFFLACLVQA